MESQTGSSVLHNEEENTGKDAFFETELVIREDADNHLGGTKNEILTPVSTTVSQNSNTASSTVKDPLAGEPVKKSKPRPNSFVPPSQEKRNPLLAVTFVRGKKMADQQLPVNYELEAGPWIHQNGPPPDETTAVEVRPPLKGALKKASFKLDEEERRESTESFNGGTEDSPADESSNNNADVYDVDGNSSTGSPRRDSYVRMMSKDSDSVFSAEEDFPSYRPSKKSSCTIDSPLRNGLFVILSGIYGMIIVVLGGVLPIAEIFEGPEDTYYIEGYYVFLYAVSIAFMGYVYLYLLRSKHPDSGTSWIPGWLLASASQASAVATPSPARRHRRRISVDVRKHKQTGSFYLRLGAVGFGIGSMIHSGLQFGEFFQVYEGPSQCSGPLQALKPITHLMFTFVQLYFIFLNAKMCINKFQTVARFGLMHMIGTNMCVWFRNIIVETLHEIHQHEHSAHVTEHVTTHLPPVTVKYAGTHDVNKSMQSIHRRAAYPAITVNSTHSVHIAATNGESTYHLPEISCHFNDIMSRVVEQAGPYLYPCTIEYSLICAGILYVMWRNVGRDHSRHLPPAVDGEIGLYKHRMSVDCSNSSRGLFMGIFLFVFAVISIIAFFVLVRKDGMAYTAVIFVNLCEIITYTLGIVATIIAFHRMRTLSYVMRGGNLEDNLIIVSLCGVYIFAIFSIIAATDDTEVEGGVFFVFADLLLMIQATLQTIFMVSGMRMYATKSVQERVKPGREMVTFLLVTNIAMWGMTTFETQRSEHNPIQLHFYGYLSWSILTHISVPLAIFFRFHSTVCLSNIWKQAWKKRTTLL